MVKKNFGKNTMSVTIIIPVARLKFSFIPSFNSEKILFDHWQITPNVFADDYNKSGLYAHSPIR